MQQFCYWHAPLCLTRVSLRSLQLWQHHSPSTCCQAGQLCCWRLQPCSWCVTGSCCSRPLQPGAHSDVEVWVLRALLLQLTLFAVNAVATFAV
jgi:hypothetical protein